MARDRNKPTQSWIEQTKFELEHEEELTIKKAYELGRIRGEKEQKAIYAHEINSMSKRIAELEKEKALLVLEVHNKNKRIAELIAK